MARIAKGWKLVVRGRIQRVRFTYAGRRYEITTGESDPGKAAVLAGQIYADVVSGRVTVSSTGALVAPSTPLNELVADWIAAIESELGRETHVTYTVYGKHWSKFFRNIGAVNTGNISNYSRERLRKVRRKTIIKELSALRRFLTWAFEQGVVRAVPEVNAPSKKSQGTAHPQGRPAPTHLTVDQVESILRRLPDVSRARKGKTWPIRTRFAFAFETALRPEFIDQFEERDLTLFGLHIRPELDKNRWERTVPLSPRARGILEGLVTGESGRPFFGVHDRREVWRKACVDALGQDGKRVSPYDLKHARVTAWFSEGKDPMGIRFLTGTNEAIERYTHPNRSAAESVLWGDSGETAVGESAKGGTRTPTGVTPLAPQASWEEQIQQENRGLADPGGAPKSGEISPIGARPQNAAKAFQELSLAWFRRAA